MSVRIPSARVCVTTCYACVALWLIPAPSRLRAQATRQASDSAAIVHIATEMLHAISTRDTALARRLLLPGAQLVSVVDPAPATAVPRIQSDSMFLRSLAQGTATYLERMWSPSVWQQGSLAMVRAPYDFHIDGTFSHCGVDVFTLARLRDAWVVTGISYTVQREGCAASP